MNKQETDKYFIELLPEWGKDNDYIEMLTKEDFHKVVNEILKDYVKKEPAEKNISINSELKRLKEEIIYLNCRILKLQVESADLINILQGKEENKKTL